MSTAEATTTKLWSVPNWRDFWLGTSVSILGDLVFDTTAILFVATYLAHGQAWGPTAVSGLVICGIVPVLLFGTVFGAVADRVRVRRTMIGCNWVQAGVIGSLVVLALTQTRLPTAVSLSWTYAAIFIANTAGVLFSGSRMRLMANAIPKGVHPEAFANLQGTGAILTMIGPPLAAPLLITAGPWAAFAINAVSFLVSSWMLSRLQIDDAPEATEGEKPSLWQDLREGFSYFLRNPAIRALGLMIVAVGLGTAPINSLMVYFVPENLHVEPKYMGFLDSFFAVGLALGAFTSARLVKRIGVQPAIVAFATAVGILTVVFSRCGNFYAAAAVFAVLGYPLGVINAATGPFILGVVPKRLLGRVMGVISPGQQLSVLISTAVFGIVATRLGSDFSAQVGGIRFGRIDLIFGIAGLIIAVAAAVTGRGLLQARLAQATTPES